MLGTQISISPVNVEHRKNLDIRTGDTVRVWSKVQEKGKTRLQAFEGLVLARKHGSEPGATFTVRKVSSGVAVERIFPLYSPNIDKVELVKRSKTRRSKLYYVREKAAKEVRRKMKTAAGAIPDFAEQQPEPEAEEIKNEGAEEAAETTVEEKETAETPKEEKTEAEPEEAEDKKDAESAEEPVQLDDKKKEEK